MNQQPATFLLVGLGHLGKYISMRIAVGRRVYVFDSDQEAGAATASVTGGVPLTSLDSIPHEVSAAILCPASGGAGVSDEVALLDSLRPGSLLIHVSGGTAARSRAIAARAALRGLRYVEAAVSGGPAMAVTGELTISIGCRAENFDAAAALLEPLGRKIVRVGEVGTAAEALELRELMSAVHLTAAAEILRIATSLGLEARAMLDLLTSADPFTDPGPALADAILNAEFDSADAFDRMVKQLHAKGSRIV